MSKTLHISDDLALPIDAATETFGIMGRRGSGKSHTGSVMAEEMLKAGIPIIAYDPTGAWYGLKSSIDGKSPGFPVVIFGGEHEDVPLAETDGEMVARAIVSERFPAILDCSLLRKGARLRFMADFLETLYHLNREAVHFFADEIHTIAPLQLRNVGDASVFQSRCVGAIEDIILQGRRRGIGMTGLSQRPALVNANVRSQFGTLIAMQIVAPLDRKAIGEWIAEKGTEEEGEKMLAQLPRLDRGTGIVWSPTFNILKTVSFRARNTFDSGRTPSVGERRVEPKVWAEIDVAKLGKAIADKREEKKANDPTLLKRRIAELEKQAKAAPKATEPAKVVEKPVVTDAQVRRVEGIVERLEREGQKRIEAGEVLRQSGEQLIQTGKEFAAALRSAHTPTPAVRVTPGLVRPSVFPRPARAVAPVPSEGLTGPEQKILNALAWLESIGVPDPEQAAVAFLAGYTIGGGAYNNPRGALRTKGLIDYRSGDRLILTDEGRKLAQVPDEALTAERLQEKVLSVLPGPEQKILTVLLGCYPDAMSNEDLAAASGYSAGGGAYNNPRGRLRTLGLIEYRDGGVAARSILFPEVTT